MTYLTTPNVPKKRQDGALRTRLCGQGIPRAPSSKSSVYIDIPLVGLSCGRCTEQYLPRQFRFWVLCQLVYLVWPAPNPKQLWDPLAIELSIFQHPTRVLRQHSLESITGFTVIPPKKCSVIHGLWVDEVGRKFYPNPSDAKLLLLGPVFSDRDTRQEPGKTSNVAHGFDCCD